MLAMVFCEVVGSEYACKALWPKQLREVLEKTSVSRLLIRLNYPYPASQERANLFKAWRAGLLQGTSPLRVVLFQVEDEAVIGWVKDDRVRGDWREMDEGARHKFLASEDICPASVEPCEWCERYVLDIFVCLPIHIGLSLFGLDGLAINSHTRTFSANGSGPDAVRVQES
ncbi:hypothetical protein GSI_09631 [Ganoderma sinense ZZ0214-1]|uniref:Uncharacterized protein n=1 Tax=Ganoderma sinense ZZ0214-1 TaxID=1077348 RepID=A0A2G8S371_9APHY|nr:hypothetical protein GSI_09631 [Ganoderma sinense ZZ0214-1]